MSLLIRIKYKFNLLLNIFLVSTYELTFQQAIKNFI